MTVYFTPCDSEMYKWVKVEDFYIFNTEYGYISCPYIPITETVLTAFWLGIKRQWPQDFEPFHFQSHVLLAAALDRLEELNLPRGYLGIALRLWESKCVS